jgi:dTDP-4-dehydrorhamnose reductase
MNLLLIGKNSLLCKLFEKNTKIKNFQIYSRSQLKKINFLKFTHIINFSFNPKLYAHRYKKKYDLDLKLSKIARKYSLIYVMLSSRCVYSSFTKKFRETDKIFKANTLYGNNKIIIENNIRKLSSKKYLILRLSTLLFSNFYLKKNLFSSIMLNNLKKKNTIYFIFNNKVFKDFITPEYFAESIDKLILSNSYGTYNLCSGLKINVKIIAEKIIQGYGYGKIIMSDKINKNDSFVMSNKKLRKKNLIPLSRYKIMNYALNMGKKLKDE